MIETEVCEDTFSCDCATLFPDFPVPGRFARDEILTGRDIDRRNNLLLLESERAGTTAADLSRFVPIKECARRGCPRTEYRVVTSARLMTSLP